MTSPDDHLFEVPAFHGDFDIDRFIAHCPEEATCKGMFFDELVKTIAKLPEEEQAAVRIERPKYAAFRDYPLREHMRLSKVAVPLMFPGRPMRAAFREYGWRAYPVFASSMIGKVIFGILGDDLDAIFRVAGKGIARSMNPGSMVSERIGERHFRAELTDIYGIIDPYYIGVCEGPIRAAGHTPDVRIHNKSLSDATLDIRWD